MPRSVRAVLSNNLVGDLTIVLYPSLFSDHLDVRGRKTKFCPQNIPTRKKSQQRYIAKRIKEFGEPRPSEPVQDDVVQRVDPERVGRQIVEFHYFQSASGRQKRKRSFVE